MMDGPLRPNALLDAAPVALSLADVDNLTQHHGALLCSSGAQVLRLYAAGNFACPSDARVFEQAVTLSRRPSDSLAIGLDSRGVLMLEGPHAGKTITEVGGQPPRCPTGGLFIDREHLIVANGAEGRTAADWKRDLMERGATGSLWLIDLSALSPTATQRPTDLAFPTGLAHAPAADCSVGGLAASGPRLRDSGRQARRNPCSPTFRPIRDASRPRRTAGSGSPSSRLATSSWNSSCAKTIIAGE